MSKAKWLVIFILALAVAIPAQAVELSLGGFPSFMRVRARSIQNGTFINALSNEQARVLGLKSNSDELTIIDTTLRLTPQLILSDTVTIRAQVDVMRNNLWGGLTSTPFGASGGNGAVVGALTADDSFRGAILLGPSAVDTGQEEQNFFNVRMLHADIVLPNGLGFIRVGRQPFDWGLGMWANGGWDPHSDLGFLPERFLWLKSFPIGSATYTQVIVSDLVASGNSLVNGSGKAFDIIAGASILNGDIGGVNATIGAFYFPFFQQDGIGISSAVGNAGNAAVTPAAFDVDRVGLYSMYIDLKGEKWRFAYEVDMQEGTIENFGALGTVSIDYQFEMVGLFEFYPSAHAIPVIALEGGWSQGQDNSLLTPGGALTGNLIPMNPAYNIDNLLFKNIIPTIYNQESSAQNAYYAKLSTNIKFADNWSFAPMVLAAWIDQTNTFIGNPTASLQGLTSLPLSQVTVANDFLGVEVEGVLTWHMYPGVDVDLIGSIIFAGDGLTDLLEAQAALVTESTIAEGSASDTPWAVQGRMIIYIDDFFKGE
ncbi:MAG: hypothetical protein IID03_06505 [Candidatus Dadabacteria bacterium]|nr:hypothetical protein [Candidatus Dadabacteria bacterium]